MEKQFRPLLYCSYNYLSIFGLKFFHSSKMTPDFQIHICVNMSRIEFARDIVMTIIQSGALCLSNLANHNHKLNVSIGKPYFASIIRPMFSCRMQFDSLLSCEDFSIMLIASNFLWYICPLPISLLANVAHILWPIAFLGLIWNWRCTVFNVFSC